jgi:hypothetical protein
MVDFYDEYFDDEFPDDYPDDLIDGVGFADPGGRSALRPLPPTIPGSTRAQRAAGRMC